MQHVRIIPFPETGLWICALQQAVPDPDLPLGKIYRPIIIATKRTFHICINLANGRNIGIVSQ